ncbi:hypothetical protein JB92DRAFT_993946 [Gautieria morchelliformis]|nr:hypothetical protein JB92DRAFT_993946 [Gautieria morchelliformis]
MTLLLFQFYQPIVSPFLRIFSTRFNITHGASSILSRQDPKVTDIIPCIVLTNFARKYLFLSSAPSIASWQTSCTTPTIQKLRNQSVPVLNPDRVEVAFREVSEHIWSCQVDKYTLSIRGRRFANWEKISILVRRREVLTFVQVRHGQEELALVYCKVFVYSRDGQHPSSIPQVRESVRWTEDVPQHLGELIGFAAGRGGPGSRN